MSKFLFFLVILLCGFDKVLAQNLSIPVNYTIVDSVKGDLDKDKIEELVVAYNTQTEKVGDSESIPRELVIYKKSKNRWVVWKKSNQALLGSRDGGMMGDPFEGIEIRNGGLQIFHFGGSSWKWSHT
ncbi:MAG: hypothetical protein ACRCVT_05210, partial [Leadbetterella sp.]